ncbi:MAG: 23S rRNA (adenine(2503)-C(2))-methyltransferase RlmN [Treponema sp.]|jgi:23S rRNA (adenine2503-C2)-methyltransferase|nr:23S rRNA (adenine(2503)-C(2))-methyltransferase RlmN [Treponema sp.]
MSSPVLCGLPPEELAALLNFLPRFRAAQIFKWIAAGVSSFAEMKNLPLSLREELAGRFALRSSAVDARREDPDGTVKLGVRLADGARIEAVLLAGGNGRRTACLSTQAGCPAGCVFCKTGSLGFTRNLTSAEIVEQFLFLRAAALEEAAAAGEGAAESRAAGAKGRAGRAVANIVIMGMGEPLLNLAEVRRALAVITCRQGMDFSKRRITLSTCGIGAGIIDLAEKGPAVRLALSLTTADEALRRRLMPITEAHHLSEIKEALACFQRAGGGRITLELVLLGGINTRGEDAAALADFARGLDVVVNLIPWNPVEGLKTDDGRPLRQPSSGEAAAFASRLEAAGLKVTRRFRKGRGVMGACGQLGVLPERRED